MDREPATAGDVLRLPRPTEDLLPGLYVLVAEVDARALLCAAERDETTGELRGTDRLHRISVYTVNACFEQTGLHLAERS